jgi:hypothetical protein
MLPIFRRRGEPFGGLPAFEKGILFGLSAEFQQNRLLLLAAAQSRLSPLALGQIDCCNQNEIRWKRHTKN